LTIEAELDNPHSQTNQQVVSMMFETANWTTARLAWTTATSA